MTSPIPSQPAKLDPVILADMLRATIAALPVDPNASPEATDAHRQAALVAVTSLRPRDAMEAMLAVRIVSAHHAAMECFRRAAQPDIDDNAALRLRGKAVSLANMATRTLLELQKCQAAAPAYPVPEQPAATIEKRPAEPAGAAQPVPMVTNQQHGSRRSSSAPPAVDIPSPRADAPRTRVLNDAMMGDRPAATGPTSTCRLTALLPVACSVPAAGATTGRRSCRRITSSNSSGGTTTSVIMRKSLL